MKSFAIACAAVLPFLIGAVAPHAAMAANAKHPYKNVSKTNDKGNDTGDSEVDKLNQQQIDKNKAAGL